MKKFVKAASLVAAGIMALQATAFADFSDMPDGEIGTALQNAVNNGLISGYEDGTVRPYDYITRAQMATIIVRALGATATSDKTFLDVPADAWYADAMSKAVEMGAFKGDTDGNLNPENFISCQETYTVLSRVLAFESYALHYQDGTTSYASLADPSCLDIFADKSSVSDWAEEYAAAIVGNGGFTGFGGLIKGDACITRGEFAYLMDELVGTYIDEPGTYSAGTIDGTKSVVVRSGGVTIDGLQTNRNLIVAYSADTTGVTVTNSDVEGITYILGCADPTAFGSKSSANLTSYITISGTYRDVRVGAPYIFLNVSGSKISYLKGCDYSKINLGMYGS